MSCCGAADGHAHDHRHSHALDDKDALEAEYLANDPTLSSCCERDMRDYRKAQQLKAQLTAVDPTSAGVRFRQQLFQPPRGLSTAAPPAVTHASPTVDDDDDSDLSDDDFGMDEILAARRKEMERLMQQAAQDAANGYGIVQALSAGAFVRRVVEEREVPKVALFVDAESARIAALRRELEAVAKRFIGSKFFTVQVSSSDEEVARQLRLRRLPCVAAFRDGERVDAMAIEDGALEDPQVLCEAQLLPWLTMCGVLSSDRRQPPPSSSASAQKKKKKIRGDDDSEDDEPSGFDCGMDNCRLRFTYEHEHVGSSKEVKAEVSAWRQPTVSH